MRHLPTKGSLATAWLAAAFLAAAAAASAPSPDPARAAYKTAIEKLNADHKVLLQSALDRYGKYLDMARDSFQKQGDLDVLLEIIEEQKRFAAEKSVPNAASAEGSPVVFWLRTYYERLVARAEAQKDERHLAIVKSHLGELDALKRDLTRKDMIEEALKVKSEMEPLTELMASLTLRVPEKIACPVCGGSGKVETACTACQGGICASCDGRGWKEMPGLNGTRRIRCLTCRGTGKCRQCEGSGKVTQTCATCGGTGKVTGSTKAPAPAGSTAYGERARHDGLSSSGPARSTAAGTSWKGLSEGDIDKGMRDYVETMASLDRLYKQGQSIPIDFTEATSDRARYQGKLLQSEVKLLLGHSRTVEVLSNNGAQKLIPYSKSVGEKVTTVFRSVGRGGRVVITYGIVNEENVTLLDVKTP